MALSNITFNINTGGLGRALPGEDYISGLLLYGSTLPSGFSSNDRIKQVFSLKEAEDLGIKNDFADETKATATITVTAIGANGDTLPISVVEPKSTVSLGTYTKTSSETTVTLVAAAIVSLINGGTQTHGYTASNLAGVVTITARKGLGIFLNTGTNLLATPTGTLAVTLAQFSGGVASVFAPWHYHVSEYFRIQPKGNLYIGIYGNPSPLNFDEIGTMQTYANGKIRQIGVYYTATAFSTAQTTTLQARATEQFNLQKPLVVLYGADISGTGNVTSLSDMSTLSNSSVAVCIAQDGYGVGFELFKATGKSITALGTMLGAVSLANVSESIQWVQKFDMNSGIEYDTLAFANGQAYNALSESALSTLELYRYNFLRKYVGSSGSYWTKDQTAVIQTNDLSRIKENRVIQKAIRGVYSSLLPALGGSIDLNSDGTMTDGQVAYYESLGGLNLEQMIRDNDLSDFQVVINPAQDVLSTGIVYITVNLLPRGTADFISVTIGYVTQITA